MTTYNYVQLCTIYDASLHQRSSPKVMTTAGAYASSYLNTQSILACSNDPPYLILFTFTFQMAFLFHIPFSLLIDFSLPLHSTFQYFSCTKILVNYTRCTVCMEHFDAMGPLSFLFAVSEGGSQVPSREGKMF